MSFHCNEEPVGHYVANLKGQFKYGHKARIEIMNWTCGMYIIVSY